MSISSCPRCANHVTLPTGIHESAQVRCPLCHAQYALSEALASAPPMLVVVEEQLDVTPGDWLAAPAGSEPESHQVGTEVAPDFAAEFDSEPAEPASASVSFDDLEPIASEPARGAQSEIEHDDFAMQEKDTEVEEMAPRGIDPLEDDVPLDFEPAGSAAADEDSVLDFGTPMPAEAQFAQAASFEPAPGEGEIEIDFGQPLVMPGEPVAEEPALDFGQPQISNEAELEAPIDFATDDALKADAVEEHRVPEFSEPAVPRVAAVAAPADDESVDKKKKKNTDKAKAGKARAGADGPRKKSLVSTLAGVLLPTIIALPLLLYGLMWMGPKYDYLGMGPKLPGFMVPSAYSKPKAGPANQQQVNEMLAKAMPGLVDAAAKAAKSAGIQVPENAAGKAESEPAGDLSAEPSADATAATDDAGEASTATAAKPQADATASEPAADADPLAVKPGDGAETPKDSAPPTDAIAADDAADMPAEKAGAAGAADADDLDSLLSDSKSEAKPAEPAEPAEPVAPRDAPSFSETDLAKALDSTTTADKKMSAAQAANDETKFKKARMDFYLNLYGLANVATFVKGDAPRQMSEQLAKQFAADPKRLDALKTNAKRWLAFSKRSTPGIVLVGVVQRVDEVGKLYHVKLQVSEAADGVVTVVSGKDPQVDLDDQVLTLGTIVAHPEDELPGYDGGDAAVVWNGTTVRIPVASK